MYFVGVLYSKTNSCALFPCIDREKAESKAKAIIENRTNRKLSDNLYFVYYNEGDTAFYDRVFIGECDEDIEKTIEIQKQTRDREHIAYRKRYKYKKCLGV